MRSNRARPTSLKGKEHLDTITQWSIHLSFTMASSQIPIHFSPYSALISLLPHNKSHNSEYPDPCKCACVHLQKTPKNRKLFRTICDHPENPHTHFWLATHPPVPFAVVTQMERREKPSTRNNLSVHPCEKGMACKRERGVKHTKRPFRIIQVCLFDIESKKGK